ncbi:10327_t:CDS:1, partial [Dentiscutata heterogama]
MLWLSTNKNIKDTEKLIENTWFTLFLYKSNKNLNKKYFVFEPNNKDYKPITGKENKLKTLKIQIYPTKFESKMLNKWFDGTQWTYNKIVELYFYGKFNHTQVHECLNDSYIEYYPDLHWLQ